jgi:RNA polymerase sigma factor (sigma-70 family)
MARSYSAGRHPDEARFEQIAAKYGDRLLSYVLRRVGPDDAADVVAETLLVAWRRISALPNDDEQAFWWLLAIARRCCANQRRGDTRRNALAAKLRQIPVTVVRPPDTETQIVVRDALAGLSDDDQELIRLIYWDGLKIAGAANVLGITDATARKRLQRIRATLRTKLHDSVLPTFGVSNEKVLN